MVSKQDESSIDCSNLSSAFGPDSLLFLNIAVSVEMAKEQRNSQVYVVEHLDPELGPWSALEYKTIAEESSQAGTKFCLSSVPKSLELPPELRIIASMTIEHRSVEEMYGDAKDRVCLLDPAAKEELSSSDGDQFEVFLFGGILGMRLMALDLNTDGADASRAGDDPPRG